MRASEHYAFFTFPFLPFLYKDRTGIKLIRWFQADTQRKGKTKPKTTTQTHKQTEKEKTMYNKKVFCSLGLWNYEDELEYVD